MKTKRRYSNIEIANDIEVGKDIIIPSAQGELRASLFIDEQVKKAPAVIIVIGSSAISYRIDWSHNVSGMWKPITELLHSNGYAVLLIEKRGINGSAGHWQLQSFEDRATDVKAAIEYLQVHKNIDSSRIGLIGHSQGGWVIQLASVLYRKDVAFLLNLAGPSTTVLEQILDTYRATYAIEGFSSDEIKQKIRILKRKLIFYHCTAAFIKSKPISYQIRYDAKKIRSSITTPIFSIYAENDIYVPPYKNRDLMVQSLNLSGNTTYEIRIISSVNHDFKTAQASTPNEQLKGMAVSDEFMETIKRFIFWANGLSGKR